MSTLPRLRRDVVALNGAVEPDPCLSMVYQPDHPRCDEVRALRTELLLRRENTDLAEAMAIVSPCAREGRSLLAAELAIAFAQTGRPTLLVDADLRNPRQHVLFGTDNRSGLFQALEYGEHPRLHGVRGVAHLSVLTSGATPRNALELLSGAAFVQLMTAWREQFRFIILDTSPAARHSDAIAVASIAGKLLVLTRAAHTPFRDVRDVMRRLSFTRALVLGAVISRF